MRKLLNLEEGFMKEMKKMKYKIIIIISKTNFNFYNYVIYKYIKDL